MLRQFPVVLLSCALLYTVALLTDPAKNLVEALPRPDCITLYREPGPDVDHGAALPLLEAVAPYWFEWRVPTPSRIADQGFRVIRSDLMSYDIL